MARQLIWLAALAAAIPAQGWAQGSRDRLAYQPPAPIVQPPVPRPPVPPARPPARPPGSALPPAGGLDSQQPGGAQTPPPRPPTPPGPPRRSSYQLLAGAPNMFGDFFGGGGGMVGFAMPQMTVEQVFAGGRPFPIFVSNPGGPGANNDPTQPIFVEALLGQNGGTTRVLIANSIADGVDNSGDGQPDTYLISEPVNSSPGPGFVYDSGQAIFGDPANGAADGSVGNADNWFLRFSHITAPGEPQMAVQVPAGGAAVRRIKLSENNSPQPRDRIFFNYNFFNDAVGFGDVNRYFVGIERTIGSQRRSSFEVRVPFASTLASDQLANGIQGKGTEFGNLTAIFKHALIQTERGLLAGGLGVAAPTSESTRVFLPDGRQIVHWNSSSVHLLPYLAVLCMPTDTWFWQGFWQFDIDTNGSGVDADINGANLQRIGRIQDVPLMFVDLAAGVQLFDNPGGALIRRIHAVGEVHYSGTLKDSDAAAGNGVVVGNFLNRFDVVNLTLGANVLTSSRLSVRPAMVIPLNDEQFDYEAMVQMNLWR